MASNGRKRKEARLFVENLEAREMLSATPIAAPGARSAAAEVASIRTVDAARRDHHFATSRTSGDPSGNPFEKFVNPNVIAYFENLLYGPNSATPMTPSAASLQRQLFTGRWVGQYTIGPPRFNDRASTIHLWAVSGGSNQFHKGKFNMVLFPPADPNAVPNPGDPFVNQTTGLATMFTQNNLQTGGMLIVDINGQPKPGDSPNTLPTDLTWTFDSSSAGPYTAPAGFTQGAGSLNIEYKPSRRPVPGTEGSGKMIVTFQGLINYSFLISSVAKVYS